MQSQKIVLFLKFRIPAFTAGEPVLVFYRKHTISTYWTGLSEFFNWIAGNFIIVFCCHRLTYSSVTSASASSAAGASFSFSFSFLCFFSLRPGWNFISPDHVFALDLCHACCILVDLYVSRENDYCCLEFVFILLPNLRIALLWHWFWEWICQHYYLCLLIATPWQLPATLMDPVPE